MTNIPLDSPYDLAAPNHEPEAPELEGVLRAVMEAVSKDMHVAMPAVVQKVVGNQTVNIKLLPKTRYVNDATSYEKPVVQNVPVAMAVGQSYSIKLPVAVGDTGLAIFADSNLDNFVTSDGKTAYDIGDTRAHHMVDAIFFPGLPTQSTQTQDTTSDLVVTNGQTQIRLRADGKVQVKNSTYELIALLDQIVGSQLDLLNALQTSTFTLTMLGPQPFIASSITQFAKLQSTLQALQQNLETLKV